MEVVIACAVLGVHIIIALVCIACRKWLRRACDRWLANIPPDFAEDVPMPPLAIRRLLEAPTDGAESGVVARFDGEGRYRLVSSR